MQLDKELYVEINEYCKLNGLKTREFIHKILNEAFLKEKYGDTPFFSLKKETKVENNNENKMFEERQKEIVTELSSVQFFKTNEEKVIPKKIEESEHLITINTSEKIKPQPKRKRKLS